MIVNGAPFSKLSCLFSFELWEFFIYARQFFIYAYSVISHVAISSHFCKIVFSFLVMSQNTVLKHNVCLFYFDEFFFYTDVYLILMVKHLPTMRETWVWSLGQEDPLEEEMATHSSILAWKIPWTKEPGRLQSTALQRVGHNWTISLYLICYITFRCTTLWFKIL